MGKYKRYEKYKDSGVEWIGEVPEVWEKVSLKEIAANEKNSFVDGPFGSDLKNEEYQDFGVPLIQLNNILDGSHILKNLKFISVNKANKLLKHSIYPGEIVIAKMADPVARAAIVDKEFEKYVIVADCIKLKVATEKVCPNYLVYTVNSPCIRTQAELLSSGTTRLRINLSSIRKLVLFLPALDEQLKIASYLKRKTAEIDSLIADKEKLIELLQEKRQAIISEAVTKGLDPNVKMKDSGIEWIGEVPEHWEIIKLKKISSYIGSGKTPRGGSEVYLEEGIVFIRSQNVYPQGLQLDDVVYISEEIDNEMKNTRVQIDDILLNITGASIGRASLVPINFPSANVNQHVCIIRPLKCYMNPLYLHSIIISKFLQIQIDMIQNGTSREGLNFQQIGDLLIVLPPIEEQNHISKDIDKKNTEISILISNINMQLNKLKEYRQSLISEAVTGKIDVREE